jgi:hemoglobin-like flavoprotein
MSLDVEALRASFHLVVDRDPNVVHRFYQVLFERYPSSRAMFSATSSRRQEEMLTAALVAVIEHLEDAAWLKQQLGALGAKHIEYGVQDHMYPWVGECLVATLKEVAGSDWTPRVEQAWIAAFGAISSLMIEGGRMIHAQPAHR